MMRRMRHIFCEDLDDETSGVNDEGGGKPNEDSDDDDEASGLDDD